MLHRSFKPAKCKTALKLAASRIKLLKNKREAQVKQLRRELAQLLESGQDQTARIRVEHVVREEKMMAAYDLIEIYCELIVARLPIIESQKNCPIDLKEAIASVIFASPRCADIPELMDVRKHFTAKYGKEFVNGAVELRPDCGVSRLLVEKLSTKAPDGPSKIKILSAIAEEHNIKWDPQSFGEKDSKPSEDLLNGPNTFEKASKMPMGSPHVQAPQPSYVQAPQSSYVHVPPNNNERCDVPLNFGEHNVRSHHSQTDAVSSATKWSGTSHPESRPTGSVNEGMEFRHSHSRNGNSFSPGRQNWNMEFKDATAAAQAAAESAERASMAARAAAELSSRENTTRKYPAESPRDEETKGPINDALHRRNSRTNYEHIDSNRLDDVSGISGNFCRDSFKSINKLSGSASLKSGTAPIDGSPSVNDLQMAGRYLRRNSSENEWSDYLGQVSLKKQSSNFEVESVNKLQDSASFKSVDDFEEVKIKRQSSRALSHFRSSTSIDDHNVVSSFGGDADENPFAVNDKGTFRRNSNETSSYENAAVVFDDYGLDEDESRLDIEGRQRGDEYSFDFSSPSRKAPTHVFASTNAWTDGEYINESQGKSSSQSDFSMEHQTDPVFSECMTSYTFSQPDDIVPATFDNSDGPSSESEVELDMSKLDRNTETSRSTVYSRTSELMQDDSRQFMDSSFADKGDVGSSKSSLQPSPFDVNSVALHSDGNQGIRVKPRSSRKFGYGDLTTSQSSPRFRTSQLDFNDMGGVSCNNPVDERKHWRSQQTSSFSVGREVNDNVPQLVEPMEDAEISTGSSLEGRAELNFENLTGGLRNKGYRRPPYTKSWSGYSSTTKQTTEDASNKIEEWRSATVKVSVSPGATNQDPYSREVSAEADKKPSTAAHFGSCDDDSDDEIPGHSSTSSQEPYSKKAGIEENKQSSSRNQVGYLDSTSTDSEGYTSNRAFTSKPYINTALSRRTKASPSNSKKTSVMSEASVTPDHGEERNPPSTSWFGTETRQKALSQNKSSGRLGSFEQPRPAEQATYKSIPESKRLSSEESLKSSAKEQPSYSPPKKVISGGSESFKALSSSVESPSNEKKASHVHPKLPDYETLTAHLQSLRQNR